MYVNRKERKDRKKETLIHHNPSGQSGSQISSRCIITITCYVFSLSLSLSLSYSFMFVCGVVSFPFPSTSSWSSSEVLKGRKNNINHSNLIIFINWEKGGNIIRFTAHWSDWSGWEIIADDRRQQQAAAIDSCCTFPPVRPNDVTRQERSWRSCTQGTFSVIHLSTGLPGVHVTCICCLGVAGTHLLPFLKGYDERVISFSPLSFPAIFCILSLSCLLCQRLSKPFFIPTKNLQAAKMKDHEESSPGNFFACLLASRE